MDHKKFRYSKSDLHIFQSNIIEKWTPVSDVWAFKYGDGILGCLSTFGGLYVTYCFRKELKIRPFAPITCYLPVIGLSAIGAVLFQANYITRSILEKKACPSCLSATSSIGQVASLGYTLLAAPVVCFYVADRLLTYPVPPLVRAPREVFLLYHKIVKKYVRPISFIGVVYMVSAYFITSQKYQNLSTIDLKTRS